MGAERWKRTLRIVLPVLVGALLGWWVFRPRVSDEDLILDLVSRIEHGVETKSAKEIMDCVAPDYGDDGGLSRADIFRLAWRWERTSESAEVVIDEYDIDIAPPRATGQFSVRVLFEESGRRAPALRFELDVEFEKRRRRLGKVWLVKSSSGHGIEKGFDNFL
jgi:hypothetical protein